MTGAPKAASVQSRGEAVQQARHAAEDALLGRVLARRWQQGEHGKRSCCPGCEADLMSVGLTDLVYAFEGCRCGEPEYDHLVEQMWHRACFKKEA